MSKELSKELRESQISEEMAAMLEFDFKNLMSFSTLRLCWDVSGAGGQILVGNQ